ncbi:hypothetical protein DZ860_20530 [Vibrio sinensis]|uniref:Uncharacterized protein n=1 Tax=Vibrio sinensis TaxID=2302434 RepID=A0A3A6QDV4_9VIBR|nr:DUF4344 domain-containing metallopeptidase [Vibrio sinensis]RJX66221.1 hypothetical protein DZ860_20530 [Vibrio sinensis]
MFAVTLANASDQAVLAIHIEYLPVTSKQEANTLETIKASGINEILINLSQTHFTFNQPLTVQYGSKDGPLYDPQSHQIQIPYHFYTETIGYFDKNEYQQRFGKSVQSGAIDTLLHTLLHEAGHAYIADQNIPILGKEEDAVDNFSAVLMIEYTEQGDEAAISAADMFAFESDSRPDYYDFGEYIDEHSFDLQRYFSTLCLVYGSDPKKHQNLLDEVENSYLSERKEFCVYQYQAISDNWHHYFTQ